MFKQFCQISVYACLPIFAACSFPMQPANEAPSASTSDQYQLSRYDVNQDFSPGKNLQADQIKDAEPVPEARSRGGNYSPYKVFGKSYEVLGDKEALVYKEQGGASWYGLKFHGHKTSNGEIYDIYGMTAAHKTLPIPSYVRVTNLQNKRSCIVRVNDRGPFHEGRVIDLSYAAATKLGYIAQGTAWVSVETIDPVAWQGQKQFERELAASAAKRQQQEKPASSASNQQSRPQAQSPEVAKTSANIKPAANGSVDKTIYLQLGAYSKEEIAKAKYQLLYAKYAHPVFIESGIDHFHRLKIGPVAEQQLAQIKADLASEGYPEPVRLKSR